MVREAENLTGSERGGEECKISIMVVTIVCLSFLFPTPLVRAQEQPSRFEIGPLFTFLRVPDAAPINAQNQAELGGRFSANFSRHIALDAEIEASPFRTTNLTTAYQGGYLLQAFVGIKSGKRWNRFGVFGKVRPGLATYSAVIKQSSPTLSFQLGRRTDPSLDVGGVLELYVSRKILLRYDFGDTITHYDSGSVIEGGQGIPVLSAVTHNFQFSTAFAFRF